MSDRESFSRFSNCSPFDRPTPFPPQDDEKNEKRGLAEVVAPVAWRTKLRNEPPFDRPCPERRGRIERRGGLFLHFCAVCGRWGSFGHGVTATGRGRWYCAEHRPQEGGVK
jgi:hypothetical protein